MTKYKVSELVMKELNRLKELEYQSIWDLLGGLGLGYDLFSWIYASENTLKREQAVIDYAIHHKDNFEVKTSTWVIFSKRSDTAGDWHFLKDTDGYSDLRVWGSDYWNNKDLALNEATRITDPKLKDALVYANKDFEAIEVEE